MWESASFPQMVHLLSLSDTLEGIGSINIMSWPKYVLIMPEYFVKLYFKLSYIIELETYSSFTF